ncbi:hypothetical protein ACLOJK_034609 [Asimina triloba]
MKRVSNVGLEGENVGEEVVSDFKVIGVKDYHQEACGACSLGESVKRFGKNEIEVGIA